MSLINDLAELARAGFKASDIIEISKNEKLSNLPTCSEPVPDAAADESAASGEVPEVAAAAAEPEAAYDESAAEPEVDYKALYEETKAKLEKVQAGNSRTEMPQNTETIEDIVKNIKASIS